MNIEELIEWGKKHSIEKKILESFEGFLLNYEKVNPEEYNDIFGSLNIKELIYQMYKLSIELGNWPNCNNNNIAASMWVHNNINDRFICRYKAVYTFDGIPNGIYFVR